MDTTPSSNHRGTDPRRCHALRIRLDGPVDAEAIAGRGAALAAPVRLWVERLPLPATDPDAAGRRARELTRPVGAAAGLRAVLIEYAGGAADLVLVAHRAAYDRRALGEVAGAMLGEAQPVERAAPAGPGRDAGLPEFVGAPAWGLGAPRLGDDSAEHRVPLPAGTSDDPAGWLAALAVVLSRYDPGERPVVAALRDELVCLAVDAGGGTLGDLAARLRHDLAARLRHDLAAPLPAPHSPPTVGLVFDAGDQPDTDYVSCLAPILPLTITVGWDAAGAPELRCLYLPRLLSPVIAAQFARHLVEVHRQVAASPELPAAEAELFDRAERDRIVALGRPPHPLRSTPRRLSDVFADRVAEHPDATALSDQDVQVTYRELDRWADRLAHGLREVGVEDGALVGVCLERSAELVAILLAVLKAGAVYVPLDPAYPPDRLAFAVEDSGIRVLVTTLSDLPGAEGLRMVTPAQLAKLGNGAPAGPVETAATPADPAYVIYTSGSTGRPKGVPVPHANVTSLLDATRDDFGLGPADVWTFFHSVAFDFSVWEIWGSLLTGGHLVVVPYWVSRSPEQFHELLLARSVTVLNQTPSSFAQLMAADRERPPLRVRLVVFGGEPLDARSLLPWLDRYPESGCRLVNMFGITETTVHVTAETVTRRLALAGSRSVGTALPGWYLYVLDEARRPVPPGVAGEIYVGGAGVAPGYLRRPELTADRFMTDPFAGGRLYRTGDRGRLRSDGRLEHLGRLDNQVKLRGFRIELDEIRSVLAECPGVTAATVVLRQDDPVDAAAARLDAYVVLAEGTTAGLRERVARILPEYMVPATITELPALPVTTNGKLDVAALPAPAAGTADPAGVAGVDGDDDGIAGELLDVWRQLFGVRVGPADDFFALGGNSLLAVRMAAAMRERGLPQLHPRTLYLHPTVGRLAEALKA